MLFDGISWLSLIVGAMIGYIFVPIVLPKIRGRR